ncbi:MAG: hypothetical protein ACTHJV_18455 [Rhizobiaceae bacterium]
MSKMKFPATNPKTIGYDTSRFLMIEPDVCRRASWYETLGAMTFGSIVVDTLPHPQGNGLRGDLEALGRDYRRVGSRALSTKKAAAAS